MTMSPRRPLILKRRKLPFQQNDPPAAEAQSHCAASGSKEPSESASQCFPDGIRFMDHPSMSDTQVVIIPETANFQSVIGALTAKDKECGVQGPHKFILLGGNGSSDSGSFRQPAAEGDNISARSTAGQPGCAETPNAPSAKPHTGIQPLDGGPLDDSLTNIQWLGSMSSCALEPDPLKEISNKENQSSNPPPSQAQTTTEDTAQQSASERPQFSYMAMIQFAINSRKDRRMTLKEIYRWIEDHFPYFREVAKPGWKNSIRHNLSLHDMFIREASPDGKLSFWTIRPEAQRFLTLDQVYRPGCDSVTAPVPMPLLFLPQHQSRKILPDVRKPSTGSERRMKPLLPRTDSYLLSVQLPVASSICLPSSSAQFTPSCSQQRHFSSRGAKRVRIAPKVTQSDTPAAATQPQSSKDLKVNLKDEPLFVPIKCETPESLPKRQASSSRRKQRLVPLLLYPDDTFFDSGVASDASTFQDMRDTELVEHQHEQCSPDREFSFKTPIKSSNHLTSSTPSKPPSSFLPEPWKVTPVGKGNQNAPDFSPIRTPGGPAVTPWHDYTTISFNSTPFKDLPLFNSPRELFTSTPSRVPGSADSPTGHLQSSCSRELLHAGGATPTNCSITEGLVQDTMNDSLSKILVDISFSCLDDEDLDTANISWSEFISQLK